MRVSQEVRVEPRYAGAEDRRMLAQLRAGVVAEWQRRHSVTRQPTDDELRRFLRAEAANRRTQRARDLRPTQRGA